MLTRKNSIALIISWIGIIEIIAGFILGLLLGHQEVVGYYSRRTKQNWTVTSVWRLASFLRVCFLSPYRRLSNSYIS